jgi:RNA polymerase sigma-70 factor (ECF subfamily)
MSWDEVSILVDQAKAGDREAFGILAERFQQSVKVLALTKVKNEAEAQELTQEVFVHAMRKLPQLRDSRCFGGWLRQITTRMAVNHLSRKGGLRRKESELLDSYPGEEMDPSEVMERVEAKRSLVAALLQLKPLDSQILELFYLRDHSLIEIQEMLDVPVGTVKRRLHVARKRLKQILESDGQTRTRGGKTPGARGGRLALSAV